MIAFIGDGSLTAGLAFEGMNQAGHLKKRMIVILNDNEMSIARNVGALSGYLSQILTGQHYNKMRDIVEAILKSVPGVGSSMIKMAKAVEDTVKRLFVPGMLFEELGFHYIGPVDGHDVDRLENALTKAREVDDPVLLHIKTKKGKGYRFSEKQPDKWHGTSAFDVDTGKSIGKPSGRPSYTRKFSGETMVELAAEDDRITAITAAMPSGTGLDEFARIYPTRFFDAGIAEQHAVTFAGGQAIAGTATVCGHLFHVSPAGPTTRLSMMFA